MAGGGMRILRISREDAFALGIDEVARRVRALIPELGSVAAEVAEIVEEVASRGDAAVLELTGRLDLGGGPPLPLEVPRAQLDAAIKVMPREVIAGLQVSITNVADVAQSVLGGDARVSLPQGHTVTMREVPLDSAAVYVPGGRAPYPSTAVMGVVSARAAGVMDVCVCAPPRGDGEIDPVVLGTCRLLGVERVYRMGGAQAVAALACGTETIPAVDVIVGPGNLYVQEAKRQLSARVGIDGIAGPSDLVIACGAEADPRLAALDMGAQAEHGHGSLVVAICHERGVLDAIETELERIAAEHPRLAGSGRDGAGRAAIALVCSQDAEHSLALADRLAPEHLQLIGAEVEQLAHRVAHAGCLFVGECSATAFGDYVAGSNHILPTGGAARFSSVLNPACFRRRMAEVRIERPAAAKLAAAGAPIAIAEGFTLHAESMRARAGALAEQGAPRASGPSAQDGVQTAPGAPAQAGAPAEARPPAQIEENQRR